MPVVLSIQNRQQTRRVNIPLLRRVARALLGEKLGIVSGELNVVLVGDSEMTSVNEGFLQHEGSTDVITFDYSEPGTLNSKPGTVINGEIIVCVDEAIRQSRRFKTDWQSEVVRYVVHGVLHLLGHDDKQSAARKRMKREENRLARELAAGFRFRNLSGK